jgi:iron complex transport system substrate-binding protein
MKKKLLSVVMSVVLSGAVLAGCGNTAAVDTPAVEVTADVTEEVAEAVAAEATTEEAAEEAAGVQDRAGNDIVLPASVNSIISMAPSITRTLIDLGLADKIVACDTYSYGSYGSALKEDIPQFDMMAPDQEAIVMLGADIVFTSGMSAAHGSDVFESVKEAGVCVADIPSSTSIAAIEDDIRFIASCTGNDAEAEKICADMEDAIATIKDLAASVPEEEKKSVLFELYTPSAENPVIYTAGNGTYINEMLEIIGAKNVAAEETDQWPALNEEAAVLMNPDVILTADMYTPDVINTILSMEGWENVNAVVNKQVYMLDADSVNQPNQHVISAMVQMAKAVYPDVFAAVEDPFDAE